jgi:hypothetical protein
MSEITWTADNNSSFLNGVRWARTRLGALRAAIRYANDELHGEGEIRLYEDHDLTDVYVAGLLAGTPRFKWVRKENA